MAAMRRKPTLQSTATFSKQTYNQKVGSTSQAGVCPVSKHNQNVECGADSLLMGVNMAANLSGVIIRGLNFADFHKYFGQRN